MDKPALVATSCFLKAASDTQPTTAQATRVKAARPLVEKPLGVAGRSSHTKAPALAKTLDSGTVIADTALRTPRPGIDSAEPPPTTRRTSKIRAEFGQFSAPLVKQSGPVGPDAGGVPLASVVFTAELTRRPARAPDYKTENRALVALSQALADSPATILETLSETILEALKVGSVGISLLAKDGQNFVWPAIAGLWNAQVGNGARRDFGPCGDVLDSTAPLLFRHPEKRYPYLRDVTPSIEEALLVPFYIKGEAIGTIWALAHDEKRKFDAEDLRQLESLSRFAAGAYSAIECVNHALCLLEEKRQSNAEVEKLGSQLQQSALLYSALFESIDEGFCIIEKIAGAGGEAIDFRYIQANPAFELQAGLRGLPGKTLKQVFPDEWQERLLIYDTVLRTGEPQRFERGDISRGFVLELYAFRIEDDTRSRIAVSFRDVTERRQAEAAVRAHEQRERLALDTADLGTFNIDPATNNLITDKRFNAIFGVITGKIDYEQAFAIVHPDDRDAQRAAVAAAISPAAPIPYASEYRVVHNDGSVHWVFAKGRANFRADKDGAALKLFSFDGTVADITERKQAEERLRLRTMQFETLLNDAPLGVYLVDADFRISHVNPVALKSLKNLLDPIGRDFAEAVRLMYPAAAADKVVKRFRHTMATGEPWEVAQWVELRNDNRPSAFYEWQINRIALHDGRYGVVCYFRDVSGRVQRELQVREAEERYRNLFNSMDEGFCIIEMIFDAQQQKAVDYRFLEVNPAFEKQSGMQGVVGRRVREMIPDLEDHWFENYGSVALTGKPLRFVNEVKGLDKWLDIYAARLGETPNSQVAVIFSNITERTRVEEALRSSEQRFRALFDRGPLAMYTVDAAGTVQEYNRVAVALWGREPVRGDPGEKYCGACRLFLPDGSALPHEQTPVAAVLKGEIPFAQDVEVIIERPDGSRTTVVANIVPLLSAEGNITGAINCLYDITERSLLERRSHEQAESLADLHRRKDEFLAMLSHELRSPLAPIANSLQLLRLQKNEEPLQRQARHVIERQVGQLKHLVDDLLEVSRITSGRVQLRQEQIDARSVVESAVETTRPFITQKRHTLEVSLPAQPVWLHADGSRLQQVVVNLLTNATKYTDEGGRIFLSVGAEGDEAVIRVRDNGIGIAPDLLPHVFDLFTQADRSLDRSQGGLGIGLSLVRQLVDLHDGTVKARSVVGQGSEFTVRLPLFQSLLPPFQEPFVDTEGQAGSGCRVLVVDDNIDAAQSMAKLLELSGHEIRMSHDGPGALKAALAWRPDAVLLDIGLPGLNGFEVARQIREDPALAGMLLVALTGYGQEADRRRSQDAGFDYHLVKPADFDEIEKILASATRKIH